MFMFTLELGLCVASSRTRLITLFFTLGSGSLLLVVVVAGRYPLCPYLYGSPVLYLSPGYPSVTTHPEHGMIPHYGLPYRPST